MAYGTVKVDNITFDNGGSDQNVTVSGLYRATTSGITLSGTIAAATVSGVTVIGSTTVSGATVTGTTANFTSGNFGNIISSAATMSGALIMANQQQVRFREAVGNGVNHIALQAPAIVSADQTITLPDQTGTVITTGDNGSVSSAMLATNLTISAAAGSASAPTITFTGDTNTGLYSPGADQVAISTNAVERVEFGTSEVVFNDGGENYDFRIEGDTDSSLFFVDASTDRVGIGTTGPRFNLSLGTDVSTSTATPSTIDLGGTFSNTDGQNLKLRLYWDANSTVAGLGVSATSVDYVTFANSAHTFYAGTTERVRIDSSGRLLVGTSTSIQNLLQGALQIVGTSEDSYITATRYSSTASDPAGIVLGRSKSSTKGTNTIVASGDALGVISFSGANGTSFDQAASIAAFVDGTPGASGDMPGRLVFSVTADGASSPTEALRISNDRSITVSDGGNVVLGTTTGTKIGTATTQKLGFYNATPVVQPTAVADATDAATVITQLNALLAKLRTLGIIAT
jgi:hypothetical protein